MSAKAEHDKLADNFPWTARQARRAKGGRKSRKQALTKRLLQRR